MLVDLVHYVQSFGFVHKLVGFNMVCLALFIVWCCFAEDDMDGSKYGYD